jgi:hypothetical protein
MPRVPDTNEIINNYRDFHGAVNVLNCKPDIQIISFVKKMLDLMENIKNVAMELDAYIRHLLCENSRLTRENQLLREQNHYLQIKHLASITVVVDDETPPPYYM